MRPVNLIPPDERRGDAAPLRTGSLIYVLVGGMALLLLGIVVVALTGKQISDRKAEKASLTQELQQETARANSLAAFASFRAVQEERAATVSSLANSRFDWDRVLHELALVLPSYITVSSIAGTVSPDVQIEGGGEVQLRASIAGPALEISGCAPGQEAVAGFVSALEDIDGVTRVGLDSSKIDEARDSGSSSSGSTSSSSSGGSASTECFAGARTANFKVVVAFDAVPAPATATTAPSVPASVASPTDSGQGQVADAQAQQSTAQASVREKTVQAKNQTQRYIPGG